MPVSILLSDITFHKIRECSNIKSVHICALTGSVLRKMAVEWGFSTLLQLNSCHLTHCNSPATRLHQFRKKTVHESSYLATLNIFFACRIFIFWLHKSNIKDRQDIPEFGVCPTRPSCARALPKELGHWICSQNLQLSSGTAFGSDWQMTSRGSTLDSNLNFASLPTSCKRFICFEIPE